VELKRSGKVPENDGPYGTDGPNLQAQQDENQLEAIELLRGLHGRIRRTDASVHVGEIIAAIACHC
jgi:hypothetical protein